MRKFKIGVCLVVAIVLIFIGILNRENTAILDDCKIIGETKWYTQSGDSKSFIASSLDINDSGYFTISLKNGELWDSDDYMLVSANGYETEAQIYVNHDDNEFVFIPYDNNLSGYEIIY